MGIRCYDTLFLVTTKDLRSRQVGNEVMLNLVRGAGLSTKSEKCFVRVSS